jgi:hypothetical protein
MKLLLLLLIRKMSPIHSPKQNLYKLKFKKDLLKNNYKFNPTQNILLNIMDVLKQINTLEKKSKVLIF